MSVVSTSPHSDPASTSAFANLAPSPDAGPTTSGAEGTSFSSVLAQTDLAHGASSTPSSAAPAVAPDLATGTLGGAAEAQLTPAKNLVSAKKDVLTNALGLAAQLLELPMVAMPNETLPSIGTGKTNAKSADKKTDAVAVDLPTAAKLSAEQLAMVQAAFVQAGAVPPPPLLPSAVVATPATSGAVDTATGDGVTAQIKALLAKGAAGVEIQYGSQGKVAVTELAAPSSQTSAVADAAKQAPAISSGSGARTTPLAAAQVGQSPPAATVTTPSLAIPAPAADPAMGPAALLAAQSSASASIQGVSTKPDTASSAREKIAGRVRSMSVSGGKTLSAGQKNQSLAIDSKAITEDTPIVGTDSANRVITMSLESRTSPKAFALEDSVSAAGTTVSTPSGLASAGAASTKSAPLSQAAQLVSDIHDIADGMWAVGRNTVEVKFQFSETEKLSVRVDYRDGVVQATFRTDSPELRSALANEWRAQANSSEQRPYRVADPVFEAGTSTGFSSGGDSSRQQRASDDTAAPNALFPFSHRSGISTTATVSPTVQRMVRPDTALHLHAFA